LLNRICIDDTNNVLRRNYGRHQSTYLNKRINHQSLNMDKEKFEDTKGGNQDP